MSDNAPAMTEDQVVDLMNTLTDEGRLYLRPTRRPVRVTAKRLHQSANPEPMETIGWRQGWLNERACYYDAVYLEDQAPHVGGTSLWVRWGRYGWPFSPQNNDTNPALTGGERVRKGGPDENITPAFASWAPGQPSGDGYENRVGPIGVNQQPLDG